MPQTWTEHWADDGAVDPEQREAHVHLLGNLTLTSGPLNSSLSNGSWDVKRHALDTHSLLLLNREITRHGAWDEALIDQRGRQLAEAICKLWPGPHTDLWPATLAVGVTTALTEPPPQAADEAPSHDRGVDNVSGSRAGQDELAALIDRFRREESYPRQEDKDQIAAREELLETLTRPSLDSTIADPTMSDVGAFRRIASDAYGGPGNQVQLNVHLSSGTEAVATLARSIRHLLYGPGREVDRLDDVLEHSSWKVRGFGEALAVKCLAIVYRDRWLPLFLYPGENGKRAMMRLTDLPANPLEERGRSRAELAKESNDILRELMKPYFGADSWGPVRFLWWHLHSANTDRPRRAPQTANDDH